MEAAVECITIEARHQHHLPFTPVCLFAGPTGLRLHTEPGQPNPSLAQGFAGGKVGGG